MIRRSKHHITGTMMMAASNALVASALFGVFLVESMAWYLALSAAAILLAAGPPIVTK